MRKSNEFNQEVLGLLNKVVKKRDFNYHELSKRLGVTSSAAYKMLQGRALTVNRLKDLSEALDYNFFTSLADKFELSEPKEPDIKGLREQELEQRINELEIENRTLLKILQKGE